MGLVLRCDECNKSYRTLEQLEKLRDNESICLRCRALIEVDDWDELLATWEEVEEEEAEEDFDDVEIDVDVDAPKEEEPEEEEPEERAIDLVDEEGAFPAGMTSLDEEESEEEDEEESEDE